MAISAFGKLLTGPLVGWNHSESGLNRSIQETRDKAWDSITAVWSHIRLLGHHGHHDRADLAATDRDRRVLGDPRPRGYARLYRGMHHLSDVVVGAINGLICAALAAGSLLHQRRGTTQVTD